MGFTECARWHSVQRKIKQELGPLRRVETVDRVSKKGGKRAIGLGFLKDRATTSFTQTIYGSVAMQAIQKQQDLKNLCDKKKTQVRPVREPGTLGGKRKGSLSWGRCSLKQECHNLPGLPLGLGSRKSRKKRGKHKKHKNIDCFHLRLSDRSQNCIKKSEMTVLNLECSLRLRH